MLPGVHSAPVSPTVCQNASLSSTQKPLERDNVYGTRLAYTCLHARICTHAHGRACGCVCECESLFHDNVKASSMVALKHQARRHQPARVNYHHRSFLLTPRSMTNEFESNWVWGESFFGPNARTCDESPVAKQALLWLCAARRFRAPAYAPTVRFCDT